MKKFASGFVICMAIAGSGLVAHANPADESLDIEQTVQQAQEVVAANEINGIEVIKPQQDYTVTSNSTAVVSGKGKEGTSVVLEVYGQEDNISLELEDEYEKALSSGEEQRSTPKKFTKLLKREDFTIGSMGMFVKEIKLNVGDNKVIIKSGGSKTERIIRYKKIEKEDVKKSISKIQESGTTQLINGIVSQQ